MQCKDIPEGPILKFLDHQRDRWATMFPDFPNSVHVAMPGAPHKLVRAKMQSLIRRGLVSGCTCGCRGDFELTEKGYAALGEIILKEIK